MAWEIYNESEGKIQLTVINPGVIIGPSINNVPFSSGSFIKHILNNEIDEIYYIAYPLVDVRDVA